MKLAIKHSKLLEQAGFHLDPRWMKPSIKTGAPRKEYLCYWINEKGVLITIFNTEKYTIKKLVERVQQQAFHLGKRAVQEKLWNLGVKEIEMKDVT